MCVCLSLHPIGWAHSLWRFLGPQLEPLFSKELIRVFEKYKLPTVKIYSPLGAQAGAFYDFLLVKILEYTLIYLVF